MLPFLIQLVQRLLVMPPLALATRAPRRRSAAWAWAWVFLLVVLAHAPLLVEAKKKKKGKHTKTRIRLFTRIMIFLLLGIFGPALFSFFRALYKGTTDERNTTSTTLPA